MQQDLPRFSLQSQPRSLEPDTIVYNVLPATDIHRVHRTVRKHYSNDISYSNLHPNLKENLPKAGRQIVLPSVAVRADPNRLLFRAITVGR